MGGGAMRIRGWALTEERQAETGSRYQCWTRDADGIEVVVRISDHDECYPPARAVRQIDVSPGGFTLRQAAAMLRDGHLPEPEPGPSDSEREAAREYEARQREQERRARDSAAALRAELNPADFAEFRERGSNRPAARAVAQRLGLGVGRVYRALTGKVFSRSHGR